MHTDRVAGVADRELLGKAPSLNKPRNVFERVTIKTQVG